ncbi:hypothetical protein AHiyo8_57880 [Arthrobacter sp. Hiyo8]|nr:hypothetical protein AHiyo8_57880 [Arthrobacter sp. Hiyo8]
MLGSELVFGLLEGDAFFGDNLFQDFEGFGNDFGPMPSPGMTARLIVAAGCVALMFSDCQRIHMLVKIVSPFERSKSMRSAPREKLLAWNK